MRVFRVETIDGDGLFMSGKAGDIVDLYEISHHYDHPGPHSDQALKGVWEDIINQGDYRFGCRSAEQLRIIFRGEKLWKAFADLDLFVSVYEVDERHVRFGTHQVIWPECEATLVLRTKPDFYRDDYSIEGDNT